MSNHTVSTVRLGVTKCKTTNKNIIVAMADKQLFESESLSKCISYANRQGMLTTIS